MEFRPTDMKFGGWYVVEVAFDESNPIHRAIASSVRTNNMNLVHVGGEEMPTISCDLYGNYDGIKTVKLHKLAFFRVIAEVTDMKVAFPNKYFLPKSATKTEGAMRGEDEVAK